MLNRVLPLALLYFSSVFAQAQNAQWQIVPKVGSDPGIIIITFVLPNGAIYANLPEDMSPGDKLSGSASIDAHGATEPERCKTWRS